MVGLTLPWLSRLTATGALRWSRATARQVPSAPRCRPRTQIEKSGYTGVRGLQRTGDGTWRAVARDQRNAPVAVSLDNQGNVTPTK